MLIEPLFVQQIVDMYSAGKNQKEIVETTGQKYSVVRYWLKKKNLYDPGRRQTWKAHAMQGVQKYNEQLKQEAETRLAFSLIEKGFAYLGGYDGRESSIKLSCLSCGNEFTRCADKQFKNSKTIECPFCGEKAKAKAEAKAEKEAERIKRREEYERQLEHWKQIRDERELEKQNRLNELHVCKECGCLFTYRSYAQSIGVEPVFIQHVECCSKACVERQKLKKRREHKTERSHIKRAKIHGCEWERGITLRKLIARDGLRCAICGKMCDRNDRSYGNGNGPLYPSIDHIIPISKGGGHTWENVQVAHLYCNTLKNDKLDEKYGNVS